jgi:hypothetical protein
MGMVFCAERAEKCDIAESGKMGRNITTEWRWWWRRRTVAAIAATARRAAPRRAAPRCKTCLYIRQYKKNSIT